MDAYSESDRGSSHPQRWLTDDILGFMWVVVTGARVSCVWPLAFRNGELPADALVPKVEVRSNRAWGTGAGRGLDRPVSEGDHSGALHRHDQEMRSSASVQGLVMAVVTYKVVVWADRLQAHLGSLLGFLDLAVVWRLICKDACLALPHTQGREKESMACTDN